MLLPRLRCPPLACLLLSSSWLALTHAEWAAQPGRRDEIKAAFQYNYAKYEEYAFGLDVLMPVSKGGGVSSILAGFGGSIIDSMSTMLIMDMGNSSQYKRALEHVRKLDFGRCTTGSPPGTVSLFELTIRYLGGLVSAYDLGGKKEEHRFLIDKAAELANQLSHAWLAGNHIPVNRVNIDRGTNTQKHFSSMQKRGLENPAAGVAALIAEAGTLVMEWGALSHYTGNKTYRILAEQAMDAIINSEPVFEGLWAQEIWVDKGFAKGDYVSWGGGSDSFFEYLPKYPFLLGQDKHKYLQVFKKTVASTIKYLRVKTGVNNLTFPMDHSFYSGEGPIYVHSHLACFGGGNVAFGGRLLGRDDWVQFGLEWAESCAHTYKRSVTGIGPTGWGFFDESGGSPGWGYVSPSRRAYYNDNGFFVSSASWNHQPEVMESIFYAWRITGQEFWRDIAWEMFLNMRQHCDTGEGWSGIRNINDPSSGVYDETQTFLFAELLKYLYLIFDDPERISLDEYVFNTEAHPQRRTPGGNFGKVQGTKFPYQRVVTATTESVPTSFAHTPLSSMKTLSVQQSDKTSLPDVSRWRLMGSPSSLDRGTCPHGNVFPAANGQLTLLQQLGQALYCRTHVLLLLPFALLVIYVISLRVHRSLLHEEKSLYLQI